MRVDAALHLYMLVYVIGKTPMYTRRVRLG